MCNLYWWVMNIFILRIGFNKIDFMCFLKIVWSWYDYYFIIFCGRDRFLVVWEYKEDSYKLREKVNMWF